VEGARFDDVITILSATGNEDADRPERIDLVKQAKSVWS